MLRHLIDHSNHMALTVVLWLCALPFVLFLVAPLFGLQAAGAVALALFAILLVICWGICGWEAFRRHDASR